MAEKCLSPGLSGKGVAGGEEVEVQAGGEAAVAPVGGQQGDLQRFNKWYSRI